MTDEWIEWGGGECPVAGETLVQVRFRSGGQDAVCAAGEYYWLRDDHWSDIVAYRVQATPSAPPVMAGARKAGDDAYVKVRLCRQSADASRLWQVALPSFSDTEGNGCGYFRADQLFPAVAPGRADGSRAAQDVLAERRRQVEAEGWTAQHDDQHSTGDIARAAACYALSAAGYKGDDVAMLRFWPWLDAWWKPQNPRRDLVKAGALILAEIERIDRAAPPALTGEK